ncbi:MAG TPA: RraA family protein [Anaerolineae bacterium]|nr:RraA family protein [Anaerolineae bacterium]
MSREEDIIKVRVIPSPYLIDSDEMVKRFEKCYTAALHDVMSNLNVEKSLNMESTWLGLEIKCLTKEMKRDVVAGFAFTIQWIKDPEPDERDRPASKMLSSYFKNAILCVDTGQDPRSGYLGELNTNAMIQNGVRASVIDGGAKDSGFVKLMNFPVFCKFTSPIDAYTKNRLRGFQIPIFISGVKIEPMDVIVGDSDGVIVVPKTIAEEVLVMAEGRKKQEESTRNLIKSGMSAEQAAIKMGYKDL